MFSYLMCVVFAGFNLVLGHYYPGQQFYTQQSQAVFQGASSSSSSFGIGLAAGFGPHQSIPTPVQYQPQQQSFPQTWFPWIPGFPITGIQPALPVPPNGNNFYRPYELTPSVIGWETTYDVPCGSYKIHPKVAAHMHYASGNIGKFPLGPPPSTRQGRHGWDPYENQKKSCAWKFQAVGECQLKFSCSWFQLPALFSCDENVMELLEGDQSLYKFCGNQKPRQDYLWRSKTLKVAYKTQYHSLPSIFDCTVSCVPGPGGGNGDTQDVAAASESQDISRPPSGSGESGSKLRYGRCKCGVRRGNGAEARIIGGRKTLPGEFPWTAAIVKKNSLRPYCGGVLINNRYILTAAHCVKSRKQGKINGLFEIQVLINEHDISKVSEIPGGTIRADVNKIMVHPRYENETYDYDIALLRLNTAIQFPLKDCNDTKAPGHHGHGKDRGHFSRMENEYSSQFTPVCLPRTSKSRNYFDNKEAIVTGWGLTKEGGTPSNAMMQANVNVFNDTLCKEFYHDQDTVTDTMLCAGHLEGKMDSCVGDSGGPLVVSENGHYTLAGIVSWGKGCARPNLPGVYTRISGLTEWIETETGDAIWCEE